MGRSLQQAGRKVGRPCVRHTQSLYPCVPTSSLWFQGKVGPTLNSERSFYPLYSAELVQFQLAVFKHSVTLLSKELHSNSISKGGLAACPSCSSTLSSLSPKTLSNPNSSLPKFKESKILWLLKYHPGGNICRWGLIPISKTSYAFPRCWAKPSKGNSTLKQIPSKGSKMGVNCIITNSIPTWIYILGNTKC